MKLVELLESVSHREIYAKKIEGAPAWSPSVAEEHYKIGDITFSASVGLGSVPNTANVWYLGFVVFMKPSVFMSLALDDEGTQEGTSLELEKLSQEGYAIGVPFFDIKFHEDGDSLPQITGHEGRGRMRMIKRVLGDIPVPVHMILRGGLRARDITREMIDEVKDGLIAEGSSRVVKRPVTKVYVQHKVFD